jgi:hypothetical protein
MRNLFLFLSMAFLSTSVASAKYMCLNVPEAVSATITVYADGSVGFVDPKAFADGEYLPIESDTSPENFCKLAGTKLRGSATQRLAQAVKSVRLAESNAPTTEFTPFIYSEITCSGPFSKTPFNAAKSICLDVPETLTARVTASYDGSITYHDPRVQFIGEYLPVDGDTNPGSICSIAGRSNFIDAKMETLAQAVKALRIFNGMNTEMTPFIFSEVTCK